MSSAENGRLVWISEGTRDWMERLPSIDYPRLQALVDGFDAAPADPAEAIAIARNGRGRPNEQWRERWEMLPQEHRDFYLARASEELAALGMPAPPQRPTPRDEATP